MIKLFMNINLEIKKNTKLKQLEKVEVKKAQL